MLNVYHTDFFFQLKIMHITAYESEVEARHVKSQNTYLCLTVLLFGLRVNTIQDTKNQCK